MKIIELLLYLLLLKGDFFMKKLILFFLIPLYLYSQDYSTCEECIKFINTMHNRYGYSKTKLKNILREAQHKQGVLNRYNGTLHGATDYSWSRYKAKILIPQSIELGKNFMRKYASELNLAENRFGIEKEIITSFIRVESKFGLYGGEYRVIDVLTTLAFNPNRKKRFFKNELKKALILARKEHINPLKLKGSFAGAMGCVQQMPSIYLRYGVDLDGNGKKDPNSMADCIGSIAKFLRNNRWYNNLAPIERAKVKDNNFLKLRSGYRSYYSLKTLQNFGIYAPSWWGERGAYFVRLRDGKKYDIFLGNHNYRVVTKYNASKQYATSIGLYYKALKK